MLLSDIELKAEIGAHRLLFEPPVQGGAIQSASIDLSLGRRLLGEQTSRAVLASRQPSISMWLRRTSTTRQKTPKRSSWSQETSCWGRRRKA